MKTIAVLYRNRENRDIIEYINDALQSIFGDYITMKSYFSNEIERNEKIYADAYLLVHEDMMFGLKDNIGNYTKVVTLKRSIRKAVLPKMISIPKGEDVLVVNDSYDTEIETIYMLCELGINNLNYIPYNGGENSLKGSSIKYAITPNEMNLVPDNVEHVINIGFREISFATLFSLMKVLELDNDMINRNIIRYSADFIHETRSYQENYFEACLRNRLLNKVIDHSSQGIIMVDNNFTIVDYNQEAEKIFPLKKQTRFDYSAESVIYDEEEYRDYPMVINEESYLFEKTKVKLVDETIGYILGFRNERTLRDMEAILKNTVVKKGLVAKYSFADIVYESEAMKECISMAKEIAKTDNTVLILGESGTGKELLAQSIHNYSERKRGPFIAVNCAAIPETLIESELFGYEKGSFTGAQKNGKIGYFEQANDGTLFLDEIGNISHNLQTILLRAIQERQIIRIGSDKVVNVNVRIIAATNADLENEVKKGNFRDDLYYRLNVIPLNLKSLKERRDDILPLAEKFMGESFNNLNREQRKLMISYDWPGNIRELQNVVTYYKTLGRFPDYLEKNCKSGIQGNELKCKGLNINENIEDIVLDLISTNTQPFHGIGRNSILNALNSRDISISDGKLRVVLHNLQQKGCIDVLPGRAGTRITEKGLEYINNRNND